MAEPKNAKPVKKPGDDASDRFVENGDGMRFDGMLLDDYLKHHENKTKPATTAKPATATPPPVK